MNIFTFIHLFCYNTWSRKGFCMLKSYEEEKRLFESFLDKYKDGYDYGMLDYILRYFYDPEGNHCDIVAEIRSF